MALNNPDILFPLLEDLSQKIRNLNHRISYSMDDAEQLLNMSSDQLNLATFDTNHTAYVTTADGSQIGYWEGEVRQMLGRIANLSAQISNSANKIRNLEQACRQSLTYWNDQHSTASYELRKAQERFNLALRNMQIAQAQYQSASAAYYSAQSSYTNCINAKDSQGRPMNNNCSGYSAQMDRARHDMNQATQQYNYWEGKKLEAERDIRRWTARIADCEESLRNIHTAVNETETAINIVQEADNLSRRSLEDATAAKNLLVMARELNQQQIGLVTANNLTLRHCETTSDQARNSFSFAYRLAQQVQLYGSLGSESIDRKVDTLKEFSNVPNTL